MALNILTDSQVSEYIAGLDLLIGFKYIGNAINNYDATLPAELLDAAGLEQVQTVVDLEGRDRVSLGRRPGRSLWD